MKRIFFLSAATLGLTLLMSCSKSDPVVATSTCQLASEKADAYSKAVTAYGQSQTPANCKAFVDAANAFINAAASCPTITAAQIQAAKAGINSTKC
jgi:hypothetical protein